MQAPSELWQKLIDVCGPLVNLLRDLQQAVDGNGGFLKLEDRQDLWCRKNELMRLESDIYGQILSADKLHRV